MNLCIYITFGKTDLSVQGRAGQACEQALSGVGDGGVFHLYSQKSLFVGYIYTSN